MIASGHNYPISWLVLCLYLVKGNPRPKSDIRATRPAATVANQRWPAVTRGFGGRMSPYMEHRRDRAQMNRRSPLVAGTLACVAWGLYGCSTWPGSNRPVNPVVGAWLVKDPNAPFPYHMYVFNGDGTMQQANPDAGDPHGSDSDGKGVWVADGARIKGKWVEVVADRVTHQFAGRLEISYDIRVDGDSYTGSETARSYDAAGNSTTSPATPASIEGRRVKLP